MQERGARVLRSEHPHNFFHEFTFCKSVSFNNFNQKTTINQQLYLLGGGVPSLGSYPMGLGDLSPKLTQPAFQQKMPTNVKQFVVQKTQTRFRTYFIGAAGQSAHWLRVRTRGLSGR
jgi:hypothetical protein